MNRVAFLCLLAGGCAIAFAPIFVRLADTGPVASAFWRCSLAVPVLWAWVYIGVRDDFHKAQPPARKSSLTPFFYSNDFCLPSGTFHAAANSRQCGADCVAR